MISASRLAKERSCLIAFWLSLVIVSPAHSQADQSNENVPPATLGQSGWQLPSTSPSELGQSDWQLPTPSNRLPQSKKSGVSASARESQWIRPGNSQSIGQSEWIKPGNTTPSVGQSEWIKPGNSTPSVGQPEWIKPGQQSAPLVQSGQQTTGRENSLPGTKQRLLGEVLEQEELRSQDTMPSFQGTMPMAQDMSNQGMMPMGQGMFNQGMMPMGQGMFNQGMMPMGQGMFNQQNPLETGVKALNLLMNIMPGDNGAGGGNGAIAMPSFGGGFQSHMGGGFRSQMSGGGRTYSRPRGSLLGEIGDLAGYAARHAIRRGVYGGLYRGW